MYVENTFDIDKITFSTDIGFIKKLAAKGQLIDILPRIYPTHSFKVTNTFRNNVYEIKQHQQTILETWMKHFDDLGVPFALQSGRDVRGEYFVMWKEKRKEKRR